MKKQTIKEICMFTVTAVALAAFIGISSSILIPKRTNYGSTWSSFETEAENSAEVMFFGSSLTYCDVIPAKIWESSGISTYVMAGPEQTIPMSYFYIKEAARTQKPRVLFLEVTGTFYREYESFTKVNIGYMPWGTNRIRATLHAAERPEWAGLFFPPYNYHSRWDELEDGEIMLGLQGMGEDKLAGYTITCTATPIEKITRRNEVFDEKNYKRNISYLRKISNFCEKQDITPVFYIAPSCTRLSSEHLAMLKGDIEKIGKAGFVDFNENIDDFKFDYKLDFYDPLHLNFMGAEKFSTYLGKMLKEEYGMKPSEETDDELWQERLDYYNDLMAELAPELVKR
ncbi:MAG: hypothetical protein RSC52_00890 [Oscillospiraceae bacterium]